MLNVPANGGRGRAEDAVCGLGGISDRDDCGLAGGAGPLLKESFVSILSWPEFSLICGGSRDGGEVSLLDMAENEWRGCTPTGVL